MAVESSAPAVAVSRRISPSCEYVAGIGLHVRESNGVRSALVWLTKEQASKLACTLLAYADVRP
ncbi:MAG TPA: hypothetical protein VJP45_10370 [Candidatus Limnocylindria bacterium]|nr:hypothetical protein [Candidatus Limnocylindria bacterium]